MFKYIIKEIVIVSENDSVKYPFNTIKNDSAYLFHNCHERVHLWS